MEVKSYVHFSWWYHFFRRYHSFMDIILPQISFFVISFFHRYHSSWYHSSADIILRANILPQISFFVISFFLRYHSSWYHSSQLSFYTISFFLSYHSTRYHSSYRYHSIWYHSFHRYHSFYRYHSSMVGPCIKHILFCFSVVSNTFFDIILFSTISFFLRLVLVSNTFFHHSFLSLGFVSNTFFAIGC